jgi:16S rRNA (uracil1498-N3)-methyltransferase
MTQTRIHTTARLYLPVSLEAGGQVTLNKEQSHYLAQVLRKKEGDYVRLFNGRDGEWQAVITLAGKKEVILRVEALLRSQLPVPDIWLVFAPIKNDPLAFMVEKATELGVSAFHPVFTDRTVVHRVNAAKLEANMREAAEQSERLTVPSLASPQPLEKLLAEWPVERLLLVCDEMGGGKPVQEALLEVKASGREPQGFGILIGPEGGFTEEEQRRLVSCPFVVPVGLGPRILRADTAAVAALACFQSVLGDWQLPPRFHFV